MEPSQELDLNSIPCNWIVYRIIKRRWLDPDFPGRIKSDAFFRRNPADRDGLSVFRASEYTPEYSAKQLQGCKHVASLHVGRLRDLGLEVIPDPEDQTKLLISNLPFENPRDANLERLAGKTAATARLIEVSA